MWRTFAVAFASVGGVAALCGCAGRRGIVPGPPSEPFTHRDSVDAAGRSVYGYIGAVDDYARPRRMLPSTLDPVVALNKAGPDTDVWGRHLRYRPDGARFEVRSAGSDGVFDTGDDIVGVGQLGRIKPCSIQDQYGVYTGVGYEPPCAPDTPLILVPRCPELWQRAELDNEVPPTAWDSVQLMGLRLVRIARAVDGVGRDFGALPLTLRPVPSYSRTTMKDIGDIWHHAVRYLPRGRDFEVRSAGPDGTMDTADDIVVSSSLGETIPCAFRTSRGTVTCSEPPPPCPSVTAANASGATSLKFGLLVTRPERPRAKDWLLRGRGTW